MADTKRPFALLAVGVIAIIALLAMTLTGWALADEWSQFLRTTTTTELNVTLGTATNATTAVGTTGQYPLLQTATCVNATGVLTSFNTSLYSVSEGTAAGGQLYVIEGPGGAGDEHTGSPVDCDISYLADSDGQGAADAFKTGIALFGAFAMLLIISLIGVVIVRLFNGKYY